MIDKPGMYQITAEEYHGDPCPAPSLSSSIANVLLAQSPLHAWTAHPKLNPNFQPEVDDKFDLGTAAHRYVLEGTSDGFAIVHARDWRTKDAQTAKAAARAEGKVPLLIEQWERVQRMAEALHAQLATFEGRRPFVHGSGIAEPTLIWQEGGIWCRAKLDWLHEDRRVVDDLKTTEASANPEQWSRTLFGAGYDVQDAFYLRGVKAVFGIDAEFRFVVQENYEPFACSILNLTPEALDLAGKKIAYALKQWARCLETGHFEGYPLRTCSAQVPAWEEARWLERQYRDERPAPIVDDGRPLGDQLAEGRVFDKLFGDR